MKQPPGEDTGFTATVCQSCGARGEANVKFGLVRMHCKACGQDYQVMILPAWMQQQITAHNQRGRDKAPAGLPPALEAATNGSQTTPPRTPRG